MPEQGWEALRELSPIEVLQVMRKAKGISLSELAQRMGRKMASVASWFAEAATDKFVPVSQVPAVCHALGSPLLIDWQRAEYERLEREEPAAPAAGDIDRTVDLLLRGITQAATAISYAREAGKAPTPRDRRQVHGATLLAVATLVAAAAEIQGVPPARGAGLSLFRADHALPEEPHPGLWARATAWVRRLADVRRARRELREARRIMGAMGYVLRDIEARDPGAIPFYHQATVSRLLAEGEAAAGTTEA